MATEEQPLLEGDTSSILGRGVSVKDLSRALAALRAGALPSSEQLKAGLQALLRSPVLETEGTIWTPELGHGRIGTGKLTREGNAVRDTVRDVVSAVLVLLATRNADDQIQKLVFACRKAELDLKLPQMPAAPSYARQQTRSSLFNIAMIFLASPELRQLLADLVLLGRDTFDDAITTGHPTGAKAKIVADATAEAAVERLNVEPTPAESKRIEVDLDPSVAPLPDFKASLTPEELKDNFTDRLASIFNILQANPSYQSSTHTLLVLARKYGQSVIDSLSVDASVRSPARAQSPLDLLPPVLEPFLGGAGTLQPLYDAFIRLSSYRKKENRIQVLLHAFGDFAEHALLDTGFIGSAAGHRKATGLYDQVTQLARDNPAFRADCAAFFAELQRVLEALKNDRTLRQLVEALFKLGGAVEGWTAQAARIAVGRDGVWGDLLEWVIPRIAGFLREFPLPRIEFASPSIEIALDAPSFLTTSFIPDEIRYDHAASFVLNPATGTTPTSQTYSATSKLYVAGLRMETGVGYWMRYNSVCFPITESGMLDLSFGTGQKGGVGVTMEFSTLDKTEEREKRRLFQVLTTKATLNQFDLSPHASSHPVILWFLRPLLRRIVRAQIEAAMQDQLSNGLDTLSRIVFEIKQRAASGVLGWVGAAYEVLVGGLWKDSTPEEDEVEEAATGARKTDTADVSNEASDVHISRKGVSIDLEAGIVGFGAEGVVLPEGEAETPLPRPPVVQIIKDEATATVKSGREAGERTLGAMGEIGEAVQQFGNVVKDEAEHLEDGWRSDAFDFVVGRP